jgi:hypothetical protein
VHDIFNGVSRVKKANHYRSDSVIILFLSFSSRGYMFVVDCGLIMAYVFFYKDPPLRDRSGQVIPPRLLAAGFFRNKIGWAMSAGKELKIVSVLQRAVAERPARVVDTL